ncbi:hypothetical protein CHLRE_09g391208v5 [Chlamydomonas reinhardtii]|uniref:Uncharacterized protein n=1 Tax=Chlamydomonas reinhardtii TaxID=3055 RepID=A8J1A6_CHLRE|nr:uncharacterized protein CHLRE_09g391208v5 [Chlamydomonas reinhardtii]PNW78820.1 hypothetical protein CHLRE_09g391208v5 [Chlamydomonas reinhardtii]7PKQ_u Chain u, Plastid-specific ribosomal protein 4 [Chlamydomonas reinhardtii]|eukprot:XP_001694953.1 plastid-specific ribosomal protein 4 [Chlamydomonas reinhardtii]
MNQSTSSLVRLASASFAAIGECTSNLARQLFLSSTLTQFRYTTDSVHQPVNEVQSSSTGPASTICGKGDNRTRRGKIFRGTYREQLPSHGPQLHPYPGGPVVQRPGGGSRGAFRYPGEAPPTAPPGASHTVPPAQR